MIQTEIWCFSVYCRGGSREGGQDHPPFGGPRNFIKGEKNVAHACKKRRILVLNSYPDPHPPPPTPFRNPVSAPDTILTVGRPPNCVHRVHPKFGRLTGTQSLSCQNRYVVLHTSAWCCISIKRSTTQHGLQNAILPFTYSYTLWTPL